MKKILIFILLNAISISALERKLRQNELILQKRALIYKFIDQASDQTIKLCSQPIPKIFADRKYQVLKSENSMLSIFTCEINKLASQKQLLEPIYPQPLYTILYRYVEETPEQIFIPTKARLIRAYDLAIKSLEDDWIASSIKEEPNIILKKDENNWALFVKKVEKTNFLITNLIGILNLSEYAICFYSTTRDGNKIFLWIKRDKLFEISAILGFPINKKRLEYIHQLLT